MTEKMWIKSASGWLLKINLIGYHCTERSLSRTELVFKRSQVPFQLLKLMKKKGKIFPFYVIKAKWSTGVAPHVNLSARYR